MKVENKEIDALKTFCVHSRIEVFFALVFQITNIVLLENLNNLIH